MWKELKEFIDYMEDKTSKDLTKEEKKSLTKNCKQKSVTFNMKELYIF